MDHTELSELQGTMPKSNTHNDSIEPKCRICISSNSKEELISPCLCRGSIGKVHRTCLEHWLEAQNISNCELCRTPFTVIRTPKNIRQWFLSSRSSSERKYLMKDLVIFTLLTPMAVLSSILCINEIIFYFNTRISLISAIGITFLTVVLIFAYTFYILATLRYHYRSYVHWRQTSWNIRLLDQPLLQEESMQSEGDSQMCNQPEGQCFSGKEEDGSIITPAIWETEMEIAEQERPDAIADEQKYPQTTTSHSRGDSADLERIEISVT